MRAMPIDPERDTHVCFYRQDVLAQYRESPDKYEYKSDDFEGSVTLTNAYYARLNEADKDREWIDVKFGYRTLQNGEFCIAIFKYHLTHKSPGHVSRWGPHRMEDGDWIDYGHDERFSRWYRRYREGDWNVENGPAEQLAEELKLINALTLDTIGCRIYDVSKEVEFTFPAAENSWKYQEAHVQLYRILIDGLSLSCIRSLARRLGHRLEKEATKTLNALKTALPHLKKNAQFEAPLKNVSDLRGLASHRERQPAVPQRAFEAFTGDLNDCLAAIRLLKTTLEKELGMDAKRSKSRQDAIRVLPRIERPSETGFSINAAKHMAGKTVEKVDVGFRQDIQGVHQSELIVVHFTDGSIMSINTVTNAADFDCEKHPPEQFYVHFGVEWVPPK